MPLGNLSCGEMVEVEIATGSEVQSNNITVYCISQNQVVLFFFFYFLFDLSVWEGVKGKEENSGSSTEQRGQKRRWLRGGKSLSSKFSAPNPCDKPDRNGNQEIKIKRWEWRWGEERRGEREEGQGEMSIEKSREERKREKGQGKEQREKRGKLAMTNFGGVWGLAGWRVGGSGPTTTYLLRGEKSHLSSSWIYTWILDCLLCSTSSYTLFNWQSLTVPHFRQSGVYGDS